MAFKCPFINKGHKRENVEISLNLKPMKAEILRLGKDSIIYGVGSVITRFIGLLTLPLFTAYLTPEQYGILAMLAILGMVVQPIFSLGLGAAMGPSYFEKSNPENKSCAVWSVFGINLISASLLVALAWLLPNFLAELVRLPIKYSYLVSLSLTGTALTILVTSFAQRVQFEKQAKLYVAITVATALSTILVSIYTVVFLNWGVTGMIYGQVAGNVLASTAFFLVGIKSTRPSISTRMILELLRLGLPLVPSFIFIFILMHSNKYILEWHSGLDAVGIYSIGFNLGMTVSIITSGITTAWYPFFMSYMERQEDAKKIFARIFTYLIFGTGIICFFFFLCAKPAVLLLVNEEFQEAHVIIGIVALTNLAQMAFNLFLPGLYFTKEVKYVSLIQGISALVSLPITYLLIINLGVLGAGIGLLAGNVLTVVTLYGWNFLNRKRYLFVAYEWKRVFHFFLIIFILLVFYSQLQSVSLSGEIQKLIIFFALGLSSFIFLLDETEKAYLVKKLKGC